MSDLIRRQDAIDVLHKYFCEEIDKTPHEIDEDGDEVYTDTKTVNQLLKHNKTISKAIKALPSADTDMSDYCDRLWKIAYERGKADRPTGKWIIHDEVKNIYGGIYIECSECGTKFVTQTLEDEHFCRNCGVKMVREDGEEE